MKPRSRRKPITYLAVLGVLIGVSVVVPGAPATADPIGENECAPAVLMLRGSGESRIGGAQGTGTTYTPAGGSNPYIATNGYEGVTLGMALQSLVNQTDPADTVSRLRFIGIDYPALAVLPPTKPLPNVSGLDTETANSITTAAKINNASITIDHYLNYLSSIDQGALNVQKFIEKDNCDTQYILIGYSQGALSARLAMNLNDNDTTKIIGSYLIGDPYQKANGATANQRSIASTGSHRDGMIRQKLDYLINVTASIPQGATGSSLLISLRNSLNRSDQTAYRDDPIASIFSRSLCHDFDEICWTPTVPGESSLPVSHINYFVPTLNGNSPGDLDIAEDTPGFDAQLKRLADSEPTGLRSRQITKTDSILGYRTGYTVAGMRPDDKCSWDKNADGSFESVNIPCGVYETTFATKDAKMAVRVTDSFGIVAYEDSIISTAISPKEIKDAIGLPTDTWISLESFRTPKECITVPQQFNQPIPGGGLFGAPVLELTSSPCLQGHNSNYSTNATQVFKKTSSVVNGVAKDVFLWGYDDRYKVNANFSLGNPLVVNMALSDNPGSFKPELVRVMSGGVTYYQMKASILGTEKCLYHGSGTGVKLTTCSLTDDKQLFKAVSATGTYGALSLERR